MVEAARGFPGVPSAADVDDQRAAGLQNALESLREWFEPLDILICIDVSIFFLPHQAERRTCHDQIYRCGSQSRCEQIERIAMIDFSSRCRVKQLNLRAV